MTSDVTARWYDHLRRDLVLRDAARAMLDREKHAEREMVVIVACVAINERLRVDIDQLGGLAAAW